MTYGGLTWEPSGFISWMTWIGDLHLVLTQIRSPGGATVVGIYRGSRQIASVVVDRP